MRWAGILPYRLDGAHNLTQKCVYCFAFEQNFLNCWLIRFCFNTTVFSSYKGHRGEDSCRPRPIGGLPTIMIGGPEPGAHSCASDDSGTRGAPWEEWEAPTLCSSHSLLAMKQQKSSTDSGKLSCISTAVLFLDVSPSTLLLTKKRHFWTSLKDSKFFGCNFLHFHTLLSFPKWGF